MTIAEMEADKIETLASEYRAKGYHVHVHPDRAQLPDFLADFQPDVIASSPEGNVIIEVKSARDFDPEHARKLAEFVEGQPDWRFEVALVNLPVAPDVPAEEELAADDQVNQLIDDAELLANQKQIKAAALLAWSAVEAILRKRTRSAAPELERQSSARVLKHLYSLGEVEPDLYEDLSRLMEFRNAVAHGFAPKSGTPSLPEVISAVRRLQTAA